MNRQATANIETHADHFWPYSFAVASDRTSGPDRTDPLDYLALLRPELDAFVAALDAGPLSAPIPACPGWDLGRLGVHIAFVHRWAAASVLTAVSPPPETIPEAPTAPDALVTWVRDGGEALIDALSQVPVDAPTWHPFPAPRTAGVWHRRQLQELTVHRWDAQDAIGLDARIDPAVASDGVAALSATAHSHRDPLAREAAVAALGALADPARLDAILRACNDRAAVKRRAVLALASFSGPEVDAAIRAALDDRDWQVRQAAEDLDQS